MILRRKYANQTSLYRTSIKSSPVFVIGGARSGTSILAILLKKYLRISFGTESQFIVRYFNRLDDYGDISKDQNLQNLLRDISRERCFQRWKKWDFHLDTERVYNRIQEKSYSGLLDAIFHELADHNGMNRWGDKTPEYIFHLDVLNALFPNALFIHLVRDGRDVALSTFKTHFGAENIVAAALAWNKTINSFRSFKNKLNGNRIIEIKYEDMLEKPILVFDRLKEFLGISDYGNSLRHSIKNDLPKEFIKGNYNKWNISLTNYQKVLFEKVAYQNLIQYDYSVITDGRHSISAMEYIYWKIDNQIKKLKRIDYWQDNLYKLKIRSRQLKRALLK